MPLKDKLNILCLHGYRQNAETFHQKTGSFRKIVKSFANFTYIDAPHLAKKINPEDEEGEEFRSWWFNQEDGSFDLNKGRAIIGFDESLKVVEDAWKKENFDGILAFSQGASFLSAICGMVMEKSTQINPKFVIFACGFQSVSADHSKYYETKISIPSLHISGASDKVITQDMHLKLAQTFIDPVIYQHDGGHLIPAGANEKIAYKKYFEDLVNEL